MGPLAASLLAMLAACSSTTRVGEATSSDQLTQSSKAVAVMRISRASPNCRNVGLWLGTREGAGYRPAKPVAVINTGALDEVPVAEVELHPGEYHVISYACGTGTGAKQVQSFDRATGLSRISYASFSIGAGEILNVGSFDFHAARVGTNAFGRPVRATVTVTDWPLVDLERYRLKRPQLYAQMRTRLMTVTQPGDGDPGNDDCETLRRLQAEGKVQSLPATCTGTAVAGRR